MHALQSKQIAADHPVWRENCLLLFAVRALYTHPPSRKLALGTLVSLAQFGSTLMTDLLLRDVTAPVGTANMAMAAKWADIRPCAGVFKCTGRSKQPVQLDGNSAATGLAQLPFSFVHRLFRSRRPL